MWIAADPRAHIQAVGTDGAGRRQYIYHPNWRSRRDRGKFARALDLAGRMPTARRRATVTIRAGGFTRDCALAVAFRLLDAAAPRIGSTEYLARHGSRGLTTLQRRHATVSGSTVTLSFPAKSGRQATLTIDDADLAEAMERLRAGRRRGPLLWYRRGRRQVGISAADVNGYLRDSIGRRFTAKDFRTLHGTLSAAAALARIGAVDTKRERAHAERLATQVAADDLGNTPAVARRSYIDPRVFDRYAHGELLDLSVAPETAIRRLLIGGT